jgi:hypothetical protein
VVPTFLISPPLFFIEGENNIQLWYCYFNNIRKLSLPEVRYAADFEKVFLALLAILEMFVEVIGFGNARKAGVFVANAVGKLGD